MSSVDSISTEGRWSNIPSPENSSRRINLTDLTNREKGKEVSNLHTKYRKIGRAWIPCQDIGCDDFDRAEFNRYIVANSLFCEGYYYVEGALAHIPYSQPLPSWIPIGDLPVVGKAAQARGSGERTMYSDDNHNIDFERGT